MTTSTRTVIDIFDDTQIKIQTIDYGPQSAHELRISLDSPVYALSLWIPSSRYEEFKQELIKVLSEKGGGEDEQRKP